MTGVLPDRICDDGSMAAARCCQGWLVAERLKLLGDLYHSAKITPAVIEFVDIAGLVAGASKGEGLGNQFLANISHEIRTPMTAILGYADLLLDSHLSSSDRLQAIQNIRRNGEHLLKIINDILDLSKVESNKLHEVHPSVYQ